MSLGCDICGAPATGRGDLIYEYCDQHKAAVAPSPPFASPGELRLLLDRWQFEQHGYACICKLCQATNEMLGKPPREWSPIR